MRIDAGQCEMIREETKRAFGDPVSVWLFGSRVRDELRGGDIDLMVELDRPVDDAAWLASLLEARLLRRLGGRRVDVLVSAPNLMTQAIHAIARAEGVRL